jgi:hypothetical protein
MDTMTPSDEKLREAAEYAVSLGCDCTNTNKHSKRCHIPKIKAALAAHPSEVEVSLRRKLAEWLHFTLSAAQNLPWSEGTSCSECYERVDNELLPMLGERVCKYCEASNRKGSKWSPRYFIPEIPPAGMWWHKSSDDIAMPCALVQPSTPGTIK